MAARAAGSERFGRRQRHPGLVLGREQRGHAQVRPADADGRVVPGDAALVRRGVVVGGLVQKVGRFAEHHEAVRKARRHPELAITWPLSNAPQLSTKDAAGQSLQTAEVFE